MPAIEEIGIQPVPREQRTGTWVDLFAINFAFGINPLFFIFGAIGVVTFNLPFWWTIGCFVLAQALSYVILATIAHIGSDYGIPGQVGMRAFLGFWGARVLSSGYRMVATLYWFAVQAVTTALAVQALCEALVGWHLRVVPVALVLAAVHALLAVLGFDVLRYATKVILPLGVIFLVVIIVLYVSSDDPRFAVGHVFDSPGQHFTWVHFSAFLTLVLGSQLTFIPSVADFSRYTRSRRDSDIGLCASALLSAVTVTFVAGFGAVATGAVKNPFEVGATLTENKAILAFLLLAVIVQSTGVNIINAYNLGMSLANAVPRISRIWATAIGAVAAVALSSQPKTLTDAASWVTHLGNFAAPLAGVVLVDYLVVKRQRIDVDGLYDPRGPYRYFAGVNLAAAASIAIAAAVYYVMPHSESKAAWGFGVAAAIYWVLSKAQQRVPALAGPSSVPRSQPSHAPAPPIQAESSPPPVPAPTGCVRCRASECGDVSGERSAAAGLPARRRAARRCASGGNAARARSSSQRRGEGLVAGQVAGARPARADPAAARLDMSGQAGTVATPCASSSPAAKSSTPAGSRRPCPSRPAC